MKIIKEKYIPEIRADNKNNSKISVLSRSDSIDTLSSNFKEYNYTYSSKIIDNEWDDFVMFVDESPVFQLSGWIEAKQIEKWNFLRVIYTLDSNIICGYQILIKKLRFGVKIGYLNQAPVMKISDDELIKQVIDDFEKIIKKNKISLVIISPPVKPVKLIEEINSRYLSNSLFNIINAEAEIDLTSDEKTLFNNLLRMRRQNIIKGQTFEYKVVEGDQKDLSIFFKLMSDTCKRINAKPNPPSLDSLIKLWEYYHPRGIMNLYKFYIEDELISSIVTLEYQDTFTPWKFGWSGEKQSYKPNDVFHWELIKIARVKGFKKYNLGGVNLSQAEKYIKRQTPFTKDEIKSATFFKMGFGCYIKKFPDLKIYIPNPIIRIFYHLYFLLVTEKKKFRLIDRLKLHSL